MPTLPGMRVPGTRTFQACWACWHLSPTRAVRREYGTRWYSCCGLRGGDARRREELPGNRRSCSGRAQSLLRKLGAEWSWFRLRYKQPSKSTIRSVLTRIDAAELDMITCAWLFAQARKSGNDEWEIAVDGKVMRGAWTDENDKVTLFSAMLHRQAVTIAQLRVPDGTNGHPGGRPPERSGNPGRRSSPGHPRRRAHPAGNCGIRRRETRMGLPDDGQGKSADPAEASIR